MCRTSCSEGGRRILQNRWFVGLMPLDLQIQVPPEASGGVRPPESFTVHQQMAARPEGQDSGFHWYHAVPRPRDCRLSSESDKGPSYQERYAAADSLAGSNTLEPDSVMSRCGG